MSRTTQILAAIRGGAQTSGEIASAIRARRGNISVALCRLADLGFVERSGRVNTQRIGRPFVRWRAKSNNTAGTAAPPQSRQSPGQLTT